MDAPGDGGTPLERLEAIISAIRASSRDPDTAAPLGAGPLEDLLRHHERELWPYIEKAATDDEHFRRVLVTCWAYDSPMYEQRHALLVALGAKRERWKPPPASDN